MNQTTSLSPTEWDLDNIVPFDSSETRQSYLLRGRNNGIQVKLSSSACSLVLGVHQGISFEDLAQRMNESREGSAVSPDDLRLKYEAVLAGLAQVMDRRNQQKVPWGFWARVVLIPKNVVVKIAGLLCYLYHPVLAVCSFVFMIAAFLAAVHFGFSFNLDGRFLLSAVVPFLVLAIAHELGHASACSWFGERPSSIGFALYLIFPAFYSDVSSAWGLTRKQRVIVDLGGCYFQGIVTGAFLFLYYWTGWEALRVMVVFSLYVAFTFLNPVFKYDGYWMLSDLLGVSNLSSQRKRIAEYLLDTVRGRPTKHLPWPTSTTRILLVYSAAAQLVWIFFVLRLFPVFIAQVRIGARAIALAAEPIAAGKLPAWSLCSQILQFVFFSVILLVMFWNIALLILRPLRRLIVSIGQRGGPQPIPQEPERTVL